MGKIGPGTPGPLDHFTGTRVEVGEGSETRGLVKWRRRETDSGVGSSVSCLIHESGKETKRPDRLPPDKIFHPSETTSGVSSGTTLDFTVFDLSGIPKETGDERCSNKKLFSIRHTSVLLTSSERPSAPCSRTPHAPRGEVWPPFLLVLVDPSP